MAYFSGTSTVPRNFSSASASGISVQRGLRSSVRNVFGGPGGGSTQISVGSLRGVNTMRPNVQINNGTFAPSADDKETMKGLNGRLAGYLSKVKLLEESNSNLEEQIKEAMMKSAPVERDWSAYEKPLADLREQIREMTLENARLFLHIDNARLAADDFKVKFETEQALRQAVEQDVAGLRKLIDNTQLAHMQLESQVESLREELMFLQKNHEEEVANLQSSINNMNVSVEMDAPQGPDINEIIGKIRMQYENAARKNCEDTEAWYRTKFDNITAEVSENTEALQTSKSELNDLRRQKQSLEIDLQTLLNTNQSLEDTLNDTQARYGQEMHLMSQRVMQLEAELAQVRSQVERQKAEYQTLLNIKGKLEAEIDTYHQLLEGSNGPSNNDDRVEFSLEQALNSAPPPQTKKKVVILNQEVVDGTVVSESEMEVADNHNGEQAAVESPAEESGEEEGETKASPDAVEQNK